MNPEDEEIESIKQHRMEVIKPLRCATTQEIVNELINRDGIETIDVPYERKWYTTVTDDNEFGEFAGKGYGESTILVIKK